MSASIKVNKTVPTSTPSSSSLADRLNSFASQGKAGFSKILLSSSDTKGTIRPQFDNGLVSAAYMAYSNHYGLVLRPDDLWTAIALSLGVYVNGNAEEMRDYFVKHQGKEKITLNVSPIVDAAKLDWPSLVTEFTEEIDRRLKKKVKKWIMPTFSTTTDQDKMVYGLLLMGTMKSYFEYEVEEECGIPEVTLKGTLEDWKQLRELADHLLDFDRKALSKWHKLLTPVLDEFVEAYENGVVNRKFWNSICGYNPGVEPGCDPEDDSPEAKPSSPPSLTGWVNVFMPFDSDGRFQLKSTDDTPWGEVQLTDVPSGLLEVPVKVVGRRKTQDCLFYAGSLMCSYNKKKNQLAPSLDWALTEAGVMKRSTGKCYDSEENNDD